MTRRQSLSSFPKLQSFGANQAAPPESNEAGPLEEQGLSLDELSQTYAALLQKGDDPYPDPAPADRFEEPAPVEAAADDAACQVVPRTIVEAILFVGHPTGEPLTSERIAGLMRGVQPTEVDDIVRELNETYEAEGAPYAIVSVGPGYQLQLRPEFASLHNVFYGRIREARLNQAAIDVLAVVAYHQPIGQDEIDRLRGKPSGAILSQLARRDLVRVERPGEPKSKPVYRTTERFLELFGLGDLGGLPQSQDRDRESL